MTTPPPEPPEGLPDEPPEAPPPRQVVRGFWTAVLVSALAVALSVVGLPLAGVFPIAAPALLIGVVVYLIVQARKRPGTGFGSGAALGCAAMLIVGGGACIAILSTLEL